MVVDLLNISISGFSISQICKTLSANRDGAKIALFDTLLMTHQIGAVNW
jgi:hypothetical protein